MSEDFITPVRKIEVDLDAAPELSDTPRTLDQSRPLSVAIDNTNKNFKGQQKNETVLCFTRKHWIVLLPHFIGFAVFIAALLGFFILFSNKAIAELMSQLSYRIAAAFVLIGLTFYIHRFFVRFFNYYLQTLIITNFRVLQLDQTLYFSRNRDSIDLPEIQDIVIQQNGIMKTLFNYGEITITLSSAHASKTLYCVPNPEYYFRKINKTKREYITTRRTEKQLPITPVSS